MRLIDADKVNIVEYAELAHIPPNDYLRLCAFFKKQLIDEQPTINPDDLRPHGRWSETNWVEYDGHSEVITHYEITALKCSNCCCCFKKEALWRRNYCPNCGAKMDGKDGDTHA